jgi:hypothetical protein
MVFYYFLLSISIWSNTKTIQLQKSIAKHIAMWEAVKMLHIDLEIITHPYDKYVTNT